MTDRFASLVRKSAGFFLCVTIWSHPLPAQKTATHQTSASTPSQTLSPSETAALHEFSQRVRDYDRKKHAMPAAKMKPTSDVTVLNKERQTLRDAIRQSRPDARQGDLFTPAVATAFRKLLAQSLNGPNGSSIRASLKHAEPQAPANFEVNDVFPNSGGEPIQSMPPTLLLNLPVLPKGLQYCLAEKTLALRDADANMTVDYLPNALP